MKPRPLEFRQAKGAAPFERLRKGRGPDGLPPKQTATIRDLLGEAAWARLTPAVRERFATTPTAGEIWHYRGVMERVDCSGLGRLMAWAARLIGTPVAHLTGTDIPADVFVYEDTRQGGAVWERAYAFKPGRRATARTTKRIDTRRQLLECFGFGFGMELHLSENRGALEFRSTSFYVGVGLVRLRLPYLFSPGTLLVEHIDEGGGEFRFRMTVDHRIYGRVFFQDGVFRKVEASNQT